MTVNGLPTVSRARGYILLPVAIAIALIATIAFMSSRESGMGINMSVSELESTKANYVAQAGLQHALRHTAQQGCGPYTDLLNVPIGSETYSTSLTTDLGATTAYTLPADQDDGIVSAEPDANNGGSVKLNVSFDGVDEERSLIRFDLSSLPPDASILAATMHAYIQTAHTTGTLDVHRVSGDWLESDATWNSMSDQFDSQVLASIPPPPSSGVWVASNLTGLVQAWVNGQSNYGVMFKPSSVNISAKINSRESSFAPYLEIVVGTPPANPAQLKSIGKTAGGGGVTVQRRDVTLYQTPPGYLSLRPDATEGLDTYVYEWKSTWNYGASDEIWVSNYFTDSEAISLLKFNLGRLPRGARVQQATLRLYQHSPSVNGGEVGVHRIKRAWDEGEKSGGAGAGATWIVANSAANWTDPGGDFDTASVATQTVPTGSVGYYEWDISALVQGWASGQFDNQGLALVPAAPATEVYFRSSDYTVPEQRPVLEVSYTCGCDQACLAPQGYGNILMAVVDPTNLVEADQKARDLFESWGYTVNVISGSANQATYDAGVANNDVVFISETVSSHLLGPKLAGAPIGVVSQAGDYNPDLGLATGAALKVGGKIDIVSTDHFITRPFAAGTLPIYSADMEQAIVSGILTAGQQTLAEIGAEGSLVVLDAGAAMQGGGTAAGRRVILPLGTRYRFNWDYLNANGRLLVQRALAWSMGADDTSAGNILLVSAGYVVVEVGTGATTIIPTAQEQLRIDLMESWGFTVNLISDADSQENFDTAVAGNDVAYIPQDITSSNLGTKLVNAPIGVVNEEGEQVDELGFSGDKIFKTLREIDIVDNSHYITQPFALGLLAFSQVDQSVHMLSGQVAPALQTLGQSLNTGSLWEPSLAVLEPGDQLSGGGTAAGRRVQLPWGGGTFDIDLLSDDGRTLMRRAIEWGAQTQGAAQELLFVVADPSALDSSDQAKKSVFQSWGYRVNLIDDDAPVADFDAASLANEVVYVSATAVPESVGAKLYKVAIGVVNGNTGLHDDFGFSTARYVSSTNAPLNTVASHYITQPFGGAPLTLYTADQPSGGAVGTLAAGLEQPGTWSGGALSPLGGLVTLDAGAMNSMAEETAGRRAQMPWDSLDVATLSNDGLTILRRSLEWAGGANIELGPVAHWKLDETTGVIAVDSEGGHDGELGNGPVWTTGQDNGALSFDGLDDYVNLTSDAELDDVFVGGATVMAWINPAGWGGNGYGRIFDKSSSASSTGDGWAIRLNTDNDGLNFGQGFTGGRGWWQAAVGEITLNTWQHIAVVYYAGSVGNDPLIYLNGVPLAVTEVDTPSGDLRSDADLKLTLGNFAGGVTNTFDGVIDDARIYGHMLDESEIAAIAAGGGGGSGPEPGGSCDGTYRDEFNAVSWDGTDGTLDWSANPWVELGESDGVSKGDVRVKNDLSDYQLQIADNDNGGEGVERVADLTGAGTAILSFDYRRKDLDNSGDYVAVYASSNGTAGPWTELPAPRIEGGGTDGSYQPYSRDISAFISANTAIRLRSSPDNGGRDFVFFDNIQVQCTP